MISFKDLKSEYSLQFQFYITKPLSAGESDGDDDRVNLLYADDVEIYKTEKFECYYTSPVISKIIDND